MFISFLDLIDFHQGMIDNDIKIMARVNSLVIRSYKVFIRIIIVSHASDLCVRYVSPDSRPCRYRERNQEKERTNEFEKAYISNRPTCLAIDNLSILVYVYFLILFLHFPSSICLCACLLSPALCVSFLFSNWQFQSKFN